MFGRLNYRHNRALEAELHQGEMINGQGIGIVSQMRYGLCRMSHNGCESIAVYNALTYLKRAPALSEVTLYMERYRLLCGIFGGNPYRLGKALSRFGADFRRSEVPGDAGAFIISFRTGKKLFSGLHTVFCTNDGKSVCVYNRYNNCGEVCRYSSFEEFIEDRKIISVYTII